MKAAACETGRIRVLFVDDNDLVRHALATRLQREPWLTVVGQLSSADELPQQGVDAEADIVLVDLDMPGRDPFDAVQELRTRRPEARAVILSAHVRMDLIDRALQCGAWGYISKSAGLDAVIRGIRTVSEGDFVLGADLPDHDPA